jgi:hypothetical protein
MTNLTALAILALLAGTFAGSAFGADQADRHDLRLFEFKKELSLAITKGRSPGRGGGLPGGGKRRRGENGVGRGTASRCRSASTVDCSLALPLPEHGLRDYRRYLLRCRLDRIGGEMR